MGLNALKAVEHDFECAGMCFSSKFYSFSDVGEGVPEQTCVEGINHVMTHAARICLWSGLVFGLITLIGFIVSVSLSFQKRSDLEEPLLH